MAKSRSGLYSPRSPKAASSRPAGGYMRAGNDEGGKFVDRNLMGVNPLKEQFEPTDAQPVPQRYKMAGGC